MINQWTNWHKNGLARARVGVLEQVAKVFVGCIRIDSKLCYSCNSAGGGCLLDFMVIHSQACVHAQRLASSDENLK